MKSIILFRHAESSLHSEYGGDHERSLTDKGIKVSKKMGIYLSNIKSVPALILSSTALRARTTAKIAREKGGWNSKFKLEAGIYGGDILFLVSLIQNQDNLIDSICLAGHEPYFSSFVCKVTNQNNIYFPTASMAKIDFMVDRWQDVDLSNAILDWVISPNQIPDLK